MHNFKELKIWQQARYFVKDVYLLTRKFSDDERFGLTQQIRKVVASIPSNIAEGSDRGSNNDFSYFLDTANDSAFEVETQLILSLNLEYISQKEFDTMNKKLQSIEKMIFNFIQKLTPQKKLQAQLSNLLISYPKPQNHVSQMRNYRTD